MIDEDTVKNLKWRSELNRIINDSEAQDQERLFLVSFLRDKLGWDESKVVKFILYYARWGDLDKTITTRQVNMIFEGKESGRLGSGSSFKASIETHRRETQGGKSSIKFETSSDDDTLQRRILPSSEFRVSIKEEEVIQIEEKRVITKVNDGNRWYKISEKQGQYGNFFSIDTGKLIEVTMDDGKTAFGSGRADKFFSLPTEPKVINELINGLKQLLPSEAKKK